MQHEELEVTGELNSLNSVEWSGLKTVFRTLLELSCQEDAAVLDCAMLGRRGPHISLETLHL